jgi:hypothetical protein
MDRLEKALERKAVQLAKRRGIIVRKLGLLGSGGWPDLTMFKNGKVAFLELKRNESARFQPLQKYYLTLLESQGFLTRVAWDNEQIEEFLNEFEKVYSASVSGVSDPGDGGEGDSGSAP